MSGGSDLGFEDARQLRTAMDAVEELGIEQGKTNTYDYQINQQKLTKGFEGGLARTQANVANELFNGGALPRDPTFINDYSKQIALAKGPELTNLMHNYRMSRIGKARDLNQIMTNAPADQGGAQSAEGAKGPGTDWVGIGASVAVSASASA